MIVIIVVLIIIVIVIIKYILKINQISIMYELFNKLFVFTQTNNKKKLVQRKKCLALYLLPTYPCTNNYILNLYL